MSVYEQTKLWRRNNPAKVTCKYCGDVKYYSHSCYYEDRCPSCGSVAFDCRATVTIKLDQVPSGERVRSEWA